MKLESKDYFFYFLYYLLLFGYKVLGGLIFKILEDHPRMGVYISVQKTKKAIKKGMKGHEK